MITTTDLFCGAGRSGLGVAAVTGIRQLPEFLLGLHQPAHLQVAGVPAFVSDTRLRDRKNFPRAIARVCYDSGGFSELKKHGTWTVSPAEYVARLYRYRDEIGHMGWAAPQDWMCEPWILSGGWHHGQHYAGTRLSVTAHQERTVDNWVTLNNLAPDLNIIPVVQGWDIGEHERCADLYWTRHRIDLTDTTRFPLIGVGSVCRRQGTHDAGHLLRRLHARGLTRLHGFGFKTLAYIRHADLITSGDSMAWSDDARKAAREHPGNRLTLCGTTHPNGAKNCANCLPYAQQWRNRLLTATHNAWPAKTAAAAA
ncbi:deazapurine DNA modification protein DpdA family protein [Actinokineospora diospyrosa]|uniref:DeoxyPurine in DNA protein A domain-containing protein n=1 Tax=Actinokineospora diospyrosa TaxID=103728 RepID=A0ABT1I6D3_9PSEU|nr:hypothetical protein [Actinokineospora diospyrosa]MCP2268185.1 hypothetical protein [Actinokineospora diospyrosa]